MNIDNFLDQSGKGILTEELRRIFIANGCAPACHIREKRIKVGDRLHLKAFFAKTKNTTMLDIGVCEIVDFTEGSFPQVNQDGKTVSSIDVMICIKCSDANRQLPEGEANRMLALAHLHGLVEHPADTREIGKVKPFNPAPPPTNPRYHFGGCMVVRNRGSVTIVAENPNDH